MSLISSKKNNNINIFDTGQISILDEICPSFVDTKNPKYIVIDGKYIASLIVIDYVREMEAAFLDKLTSLDIDIQIAIFYEKKNTFEVIKEITYNIGNTGANIKTSSNNQSDVDVMHSAYDDAKFIRKQLQVGRRRTL